MPDVDSDFARPPFSGNGFYFAGDDNLQITVFNALANVAIRISGRFLHADNRVEPFVHRLVPTSNRVASVLPMRLGVGWLLSVQASVSAAAPLTGQAFVVLSVIRGQSGGQEDLATLAAGYVSAANRIAWPGSPVLNSLEGGGALRSITGSTPAAGAEISETVPTGARWELLAFSAALTTSAAAANRHTVLSLDDGASQYFRVGISTNQAASLGIFYTWAQAIGPAALDGSLQLVTPIPAGLRLGAGHRIRTNTALIQAADQWSVIQYLVREWLEGA